MPEDMVVVTVAQLRAIVREEVAAVLGALRPADRAHDWLSVEEVATLLGYKPAYVSELVRRAQLPAHQPGGRGSRRMFRRAEVEAWASQRGQRD